MKPLLNIRDANGWNSVNETGKIDEIASKELIIARKAITEAVRSLPEWYTFNETNG